MLLRAIDPSCLSESPIRVLDWGDRDKAGEMFCGEVGLIFCCDDGGEMSGRRAVPGLVAGDDEGKAGRQVQPVQPPCCAMLASCAESSCILVHFLAASVHAFFSSRVPV